MPTKAYGSTFNRSIQLHVVRLLGTKSTVFAQSYARSAFNRKTVCLWCVRKIVQIEKYPTKSFRSTYGCAEICLPILWTNICIERKLLFTPEADASARIGCDEIENGRKWTVSRPKSIALILKLLFEGAGDSWRYQLEGVPLCFVTVRDINGIWRLSMLSSFIIFLQRLTLTHPYWVTVQHSVRSNETLNWIFYQSTNTKHIQTGSEKFIFLKQILCVFVFYFQHITWTTCGSGKHLITID